MEVIIFINYLVKVYKTIIAFNILLKYKLLLHLLKNNLMNVYNYFIIKYKYLKIGSRSEFIAQGQNAMERKVVIQGENGSGKSTLFSTLLGINMEYEGEILVDGENLRKIDGEAYFKKISYIAQDNYGFSMSPREFLGMLAESENLNLEEALKLADELGIKGEAIDNEKIGDVSGGEKKKLYLIASLLKESEILFLDEPGNCLDVKGKEVLRKRLLTSDQTIILITHDPFFEELANLKVLFQDGRVEVNYLTNRGVI